MKKILFFLFLIASVNTFAQNFEDGYGISINTVSKNGVAEVTLPCGTIMNIKAVINASGNSRGRMTGDGILLSAPILPAAVEYDPSQGKNVAIGFFYNNGFSAFTATAYYIEGSLGSDNVMNYKVLQAQGQWANTPDPYSEVKWYVAQPQPIKNYSRKVTVLKVIRSENEQSYVIGL
jgi:hypothetical protein